MGFVLSIVIQLATVSFQNDFPKFVHRNPDKILTITDHSKQWVRLSYPMTFFNLTLYFFTPFLVKIISHYVDPLKISFFKNIYEKRSFEGAGRMITRCILSNQWKALFCMLLDTNIKNEIMASLSNAIRENKIMDCIHRPDNRIPFFVN